MWQCQKCEYKNSNSSEKCHGMGCNEKRSYDFIKPVVKTVKGIIPIKKEIDPFVRDFCQACKEKRIFKFSRMRGGQKHYVCLVCNRRSIQKGKSEKIPEEELALLIERIPI